MTVLNQLLNNYLGYEYAANIKNVGCSTPKHLRDYTGFIPSVAPLSQTTEPIGYSESLNYSAHSTGSVIVSNREVTTHREYAMCSKCNSLMNAHPIAPLYGEYGELLDDGCDRLPVEFGKTRSNDYYRYGDSNNTVPYVDYSTRSEELTREDEYEFNPDHSYTELYWSDNNPTECTRVLGSADAPANMRIETSAIEPKQRNYYVEGFDGFHTKQLWDEALTAKTHARYLNVYSKDGKFRVGGLVLDFYQETSLLPVVATWRKITATCPHRDCRVKDSRGNYVQNTIAIEGYEFTREQMESFTYAVIRHGNNHCGMSNWTTRTSARASHIVNETLVISKDHKSNVIDVPRTRWTIEVPEHTVYYKLHSEDCNLDCNPSLPHCKVLSEAG